MTGLTLNTKCQIATSVGNLLRKEHQDQLTITGSAIIKYYELPYLLILAYSLCKFVSRYYCPKSKHGKQENHHKGY